MDGEAEYRYCYCVASAGSPIEPSGMEPIPGGRDLYVVEVGRVQAVVSRVPAAEYCEEQLRMNFQKPDWVASAVLAHERVVQGCLSHAELVPMRFCTVVRSEDDLAAMLADRQEEFASKLAELAGKQEWGIRLIADLNRLQQQLLTDDQELLRLHDAVESVSKGAAYLLRKQLESRLAARMDQCRAEAAEEAYDRLACLATRASVLKAPRPTNGDAEPVLNAAFLVTRAQMDSLLEQAGRIVKEKPWLACEPTGPWPPYSFV